MTFTFTFHFVLLSQYPFLQFHPCLHPPVTISLLDCSHGLLSEPSASYLDLLQSVHFVKIIFLKWKFNYVTPLLGNIWSQRAEFCTENGWVEIKYCVSCLGIREARACFLGFLQSYDKIYGPFFWPKTKGGENFPSSASFNSEETPSDGYGLVLHIPSGVH